MGIHEQVKSLLAEYPELTDENQKILLERLYNVDRTDYLSIQEYRLARIHATAIATQLKVDEEEKEYWIDMASDLIRLGMETSIVIRQSSNTKSDHSQF